MLLPVLVLLCSAGLVGLLVFNLWQALAMAASQDVLDARRQADFTAAALRRVIREEQFLQAVPATARFTLQAGRPLIPNSVDWLVPPSYPTFEDLDVLVRDKLQTTAAAATDGTALQKSIQPLLDDSGTTLPHRQWLTAHAAWLAHHKGAVAFRDSLLVELSVAQGGAAPAAAVLLHATVHKRLPAWATAHIPSLPEDLARPLLRRLAEKGIAVDELTRQLEQTLATRQTIARVQKLLPLPGNERMPVVRVAGDRLLLVHAGSGALLSRNQLDQALAAVEKQEWAALPPFAVEDLCQPGDVDAPSGDEEDVDEVDDADEVDVDAPIVVASAGATTVIPGFLALRSRVVATGGLGGAWVFGLLVIALTALSGTGLLLMFRSLSKEADAARTRSEFLTMVTHELKTPLAGIRLLGEMLHEGHVQSPEQQQDYYRRLTSESVRLSMLIENVLDLGRMERGERAYDFRDVDVGELVEEAVQLFAPIAGPSGLEITAEPGATVVTRGDRNALLQSLLNVMDNARKYAAEGQRLQIQTLAENGHCLVRLRDFGPGIPEAERLAVFERFERGAGHRDGSIPGVGLGLHLSREILRGHGGDLTTVAPPGGGPGACFELSLPVRGEHEEQDANEQEESTA